MKSFWILLLGLSFLSASGCCGMRRQQLAALERENSQLNGKLWEMQFQLESLADENAALKGRLDSSEDEPQPPPKRPTASSKNSESPSRSSPPPSAPPFDPGEFRPPVIEFPSEPAPEGTIPESLLPDPPAKLPVPSPSKSPGSSPPTAAAASTSYQEPALLEPQIEPVPPGEVSLDSSSIQRVALGPLLGTLQLDDKPGDDGLVIVLEPWDGSDKMLATAADISAVLIDPAEPAQTARFAQWNFAAHEVARLFRDGDVPGLHLQLPWPDDPPRHDRLHLFVRYTTSDGRKLQADSLVELQLGRRGRWVASTTPPPRAAEQPILQADSTPRSTASPQIAADLPQLAANSQPVAPQANTDVDPTGATSGSPSLPRYRYAIASPVGSEAPASGQAKQAACEIDDAHARPIPLPLPTVPSSSQPDTTGPNRPVWSPDRPW